MTLLSDPQKAPPPVPDRSPGPPGGLSPPWRWLKAALIAAAVVGVGDVLLAAARAADLVPAAALWQSMVAAVGLYALPALLFGLCEEVLAWSLQPYLGEGRGQAWLRGHLSDPAAD